MSIKLDTQSLISETSPQVVCRYGLVLRKDHQDGATPTIFEEVFDTQGGADPINAFRNLKRSQGFDVIYDRRVAMNTYGINVGFANTMGVVHVDRWTYRKAYIATFDGPIGTDVTGNDLIFFIVAKYQSPGFKVLIRTEYVDV